MKKRLALTLAAVMLLLLAACGGNSSAPAAPSTEQSAPVSSGTSPAQSEGERTDISAVIEETVLVDESDVKITATELEYAAYEVKLRLTIENNSAQDLSFYSGTLGYCCNSINGYMVDDGYLNVDVAAGKKAAETVRFSMDTLTELGISSIADIELGFRVTSGPLDDYLETGPRQVRTSAAEGYDYGADTYRRTIERTLSSLDLTLESDSGDVAFDERGVRVISQTLAADPDGKRALLVEVENTSEDPVYTSVGGVSMNGLRVQSGAWSTDWLSPGKRRVISMDLSAMADEACRAAFGLEEIGEVAYSFEIEDMDYDTLTVPQVLTLTVPGGKASYDGSGEELCRADGIRIVSKGLMPDAYEYSDDIHVLLLVENELTEQITFDVRYSSISVNGYMTDFICYSKAVAPGCGGVLDVRLLGSSLEGNGIRGVEDIEEVELTVEAENSSRRTVAEPVVVVRG